jgi:hypothetical protein
MTFEDYSSSLLTVELKINELMTDHSFMPLISDYKLLRSI